MGQTDGDLAVHRQKLLTGEGVGSQIAAPVEGHEHRLISGVGGGDGDLIPQRPGKGQPMALGIEPADVSLLEGETVVQLG